MRVCSDAEASGRAPCGALSGQDSGFLPISRMIMGRSDATPSILASALTAPPWGVYEHPYQNASAERSTRLCRVRAGSALAGAACCLDREPQSQRVAERHPAGADEPR